MAAAAAAAPAIRPTCKVVNRTYAGTYGKLNRNIMFQMHPTFERLLSRGVPAIYRQELEMPIPVLLGFMYECAHIWEGATKLNTVGPHDAQHQTDGDDPINGSVDTGTLCKQIQKHRP